jgi:glucosamine--fructose-6-phosphate aminotransferase (isomerizing)
LNCIVQFKKLTRGGYMCGIYGCIGNDTQSSLKVVKGLKSLDYRGYDNWGIAAKNGHGLVFLKEVGQVSEVADDVLNVVSHTAIGHTRWATHGPATKENAHPHLDGKKEIAVVHNGIIENYLELISEIETYFGRKVMASETDTEVIPHLVGIELEMGKGLEQAVFEVCRKLNGRFAFALVYEKRDCIIGVRRGSPLIFGRGTDGSYLSSDPEAFPKEVLAISHLDDFEMVVAERTGVVRFFDYRSGSIRNKPSEPHRKRENDKVVHSYAHQMQKEIADQKEGLQNTAVSEKAAITKSSLILRGSEKVFLSGCGTASYVAMVGQYMLGESGKAAEVVISSEFERCAPFVNEKAALVAITQSGETADVLESIAAAKKRGARIIVITNVAHSTAAREADSAIDIHIGKELAVASTKAATAQMVMLRRLSDAVKPGPLPYGYAGDLRRLDSLYSVEFVNSIRQLAENILESAKAKGVFLIGRGILYPMALEGALKIQEVAYIHANGYAGGELKHGPLALIQKGTPAIALVANDSHHTEMMANIAELKARGAKIIGVSPKSHESFDHWVEVPDLKQFIPISAIIPVQLLAYYLSILQGINPDRPRNLAKSVTVK